MGKDSSISDIILELRNGKKIRCLECGKGYYVTAPGHLKTSHSFWCDKCHDSLHVTSSVTVE